MIPVTYGAVDNFFMKPVIPVAKLWGWLTGNKPGELARIFLFLWISINITRAVVITPVMIGYIVTAAVIVFWGPTVWREIEKFENASDELIPARTVFIAFRIILTFLNILAIPLIMASPSFSKAEFLNLLNVIVEHICFYLVTFYGPPPEKTLAKAFSKALQSLNPKLAQVRL